jgi:MFS family permease
MNALIVGRVIAGIGGAGMYLGNLNLISINTTMRERPIYMGGVGIVWGAGTILGPVIGGSFADSKATWRWVCLSTILNGYCSMLRSSRPSILTSCSSG